MNVEASQRLSNQLRRCHDDLLRVSASIDKAVTGLKWVGRNADNFKTVMWPASRADLRECLGRIEQLRQSLDNNIADQIDTSATTGQARALGSLDPSRSVIDFPAPRDGREVIIEALHGTTDSRRTAPDEIEIRVLENGRYVVVLPGVTDLSEGKGDALRGFTRGLALGGAGVGAIRGVDAAVDGWYDNDDPASVRKMKYAIGVAGRTPFVNPYSERVMQQMQAAGIPQGSEVMFVGHSYGAYTAMDLAGNPKFNAIDGEGEGYSVRVTHVVAAGADTDWMMKDVPAGTHALILNNKQDAVVKAEDVLHGDADPHHPSHLDVEFNSNPLAGLKGSGHHPDNYTGWLSGANRPALNDWLASAGASYGGEGTAYSIKVPDYQ